MRLESDTAEGKTTLDDVLTAINEIRQTQITNEREFNKAYEALNAQMSENTAAIKDQTASNEDFKKMMENVIAENNHLKQKIKNLEEKIETMEQYSRSNCVEIHGLPQQPNENVLDVVKQVGRALDMDVSDNMVDACHRLGKRLGGGGPSGIIVKFVRRIDKEEFIRRRRVKRTLSTRHLNMADDRPIFVNESLTPSRRRLLFQARTLQKEKAYKFLWTRNGKIFLRKEEGSHVKVVLTEEDLSKL